MERMKVSIVITAYNVGDTIKRAIDSALGQTYKDIEVVVVSDCPTDNTLEIIGGYEGMGNFVHVKNEKNVGAGQSRRNGIKASHGDYILLLDGDDWLEFDYIRRLVENAQRTGAEIVSGGITINEEDGAWSDNYYGEHVYEGVDKVSKHFNEKIVFMNNKLIARRLHDLVPYCTRRYIEDTPVIVPMLYHANKVSYINVCGYHYYMNPESLTHTADKAKGHLYRTLCFLDLIDFFASKEKEYGELFPIAGIQRWLDAVKGLSVVEMAQYPEAAAEVAQRLCKLIHISKQ